MSQSWPVFGYDSRHAGHGTGVSRPEWPIEVAWRHNFDGKVAWQAPVIDERGVSYIHVKRTQVRAPNFRAIGRDGTINWALRTNQGMGPFAPSPAVAADLVLLPDAPEVWVVDAYTGGKKYEATFHDSPADHVVATIKSGRVHTGFGAFDVETGEELWTYSTEEPKYTIHGPGDREVVRNVGPAGHAAAVSEQTVYVSGSLRDGVTRFVQSENLDDTEERSGLVAANQDDGRFVDDYEEWGHVHALDATTGERRWAKEFETPVAKSVPTVVADGTVFTIDKQCTIRSFDAATGEAQWTRKLECESVAGWRPAVADDGVFVDGGGGTLLRLSADNGGLEWRFQTENELAGPPAIVDGVVHLSDTGGKVYGLSLDGDERWHLALADSLRTGPVIAGESLYVAGEELLCLKPVG